MSRGGVWYFLAEQYCLRSPPPDVKNFPYYHAPYKNLLSGLTKHQHAILIDLGMSHLISCIKVILMGSAFAVTLDTATK